MRIAGIIAEYNPFHNGHAWHIAETRRLTGCDCVIVCMAGHFTQRGEPAILSKWARARMALAPAADGCPMADAVFELPSAFVVRTADAFARGGVAILGALGADVLSFGCETTDVDLIRAIAHLGDAEPEALSERIREKLGEGKVHARARGEAIAEYLGVSPDIVNQPNLALAAEYLRSVEALKRPMEIAPIARRGGYHDGELGEFASASAIRAAFDRGLREEAYRCIPESARAYAEPDAMHAMDDMLMYRLRDMRLDEMSALPDVSEGLEQRLYRLCRETAGREELLEAMKCKRYTRARLSRLLTHALLGFDRQALEAHPLPTYARLIGMRAGAEPLIRELSRRTRIPIASSAAQIRDDPLFRLENRATDVWSLLHDDGALRLPGREFREKFIKA